MACDYIVLKGGSINGSLDHVCSFKGRDQLSVDDLKSERVPQIWSQSRNIAQEDGVIN